jgi:hypothetical protein
VARRPVAQAPTRIEYALTPLGESLVDGPMRALGDWITEHGDELLDAQENSAETRHRPTPGVGTRAEPSLDRRAPGGSDADDPAFGDGLRPGEPSRRRQRSRDSAAVTS